MLLLLFELQREGYSDHDCVRLLTNPFVRIFFDTGLQQEQGLFAPCCDSTNDNPIHTHKTMLEQELLVVIRICTIPNPERI